MAARSASSRLLDAARVRTRFATFAPSDQEKHRRRPEKEDQGRAHRSYHLIQERDRVEPVLASSREPGAEAPRVLDHALRHAQKLRFELRPSGGRREPSDHVVVLRPARSDSRVLDGEGGDEVEHRYGVQGRKKVFIQRKGWKNPGDLEPLAVHFDGAPQDRRIAPETALVQVLRQEDLHRRSGKIVFRGEAPSENGLDTEQIEK